jgi:NAD(P)-dependent dehydrogenase (short-subunit alcohol dehydrogenase family)
MGLLDGRVSIVTGGSSGIGRATALSFAREGAVVVVADLQTEEGQRTVGLVKEAGGDGLFVKTDVSRSDDVREMVEKTMKTYGRLDCAFNNAGISQPPKALADQPEELFEKVSHDVAEFERIAPEIAEFQAENTDGAELVVVCHGVVFRAVREAVNNLREQGLNVGYFRPVTLRPLPAPQIREFAGRVSKILVVESAYGQLARLFKEVAYGSATEISHLFRPGIGVTAAEVEDRVKELLETRLRKVRLRRFA